MMRLSNRQAAGNVAYRVIGDEPIGVVVGFDPTMVPGAAIFEYDKMPLASDDGGEWVHIKMRDTIKTPAVFIDDDPNEAEPDLMIWRTPKEFKEYLDSFHELDEESSVS